MVDIDMSALALLYDGRCTVLQETNGEDDCGWLSERGQQELWRDIPCHLVLEQAPPTAATAGAAEVNARGRLFLAADYAIPAGCSVAVRQRGQEYRLGLSGLPQVFAAHQEIAVTLLSERA